MKFILKALICVCAASTSVNYASAATNAAKMTSVTAASNVAAASNATTAPKMTSVSTAPNSVITSPSAHDTTVPVTSSNTLASDLAIEFLTGYALGYKPWSKIIMNVSNFQIRQAAYAFFHPFNHIHKLKSVNLENANQVITQVLSLSLQALDLQTKPNLAFRKECSNRLNNLLLPSKNTVNCQRLTDSFTVRLQILSNLKSKINTQIQTDWSVAIQKGNLQNLQNLHKVITKTAPNVQFIKLLAVISKKRLRKLQALYLDTLLQMKKALKQGQKIDNLILKSKQRMGKMMQKWLENYEKGIKSRREIIKEKIAKIKRKMKLKRKSKSATTPVFATTTTPIPATTNVSATSAPTSTSASTTAFAASTTAFAASTNSAINTTASSTALPASAAVVKPTTQSSVQSMQSASSTSIPAAISASKSSAVASSTSNASSVNSTPTLASVSLVISTPTPTNANASPTRTTTPSESKPTSSTQTPTSLNASSTPLNVTASNEDEFLVPDPNERDFYTSLSPSQRAKIFAMQGVADNCKSNPIPIYITLIVAVILAL